MRQEIRDAKKQLLGYIEDGQCKGEKVARDKNGNLLGYYTETWDKTLDKNRNLIGYGNTLSSLIR